MTVYVHIERLILDGVQVDDHGAALSAAIPVELARLFSRAEPEQGVARNPLAMQVAQAVHSAIGAPGAQGQGAGR